MSSKRNRRKRRFIPRLITFVVIVAALVFYLRTAHIHLPASLAEKLSEQCSTDDFAVEMSGLSFDVAQMTAHAARIEIRLKGSVAEPLVTILNKSVLIAPKFAKPEINWIKSVHIGHFTISDEIADSDSAIYHIDGGGVGTLPPFATIPVSADDATVCGVAGISGTSEISSKNGVLRVGKIDAVFVEGRERVTGSAEYDENSKHVRVNIAGDVAPKTMLPLFDALGTRRLLQILAGFDFCEAPPKVAFALDCAVVGREGGEMRVDVGSVVPCAYRGVPVSSFSGTVSSHGSNVWSVISITDLGLRRPEGAAFGEVEINSHTKLISFTGESRMDLMKFATLAHIIEGEPPDIPLAFPLSPHIRAAGVYDYYETGGTAITGTFDAQRMDVSSNRLTNVSAGFTVTDKRLTFDSFTADTCGGKLLCSASLDYAPATNRAFTASVKLDAINPEQLAKATGHDIKSPKGRLDSHVDFSGVLSTNLASTLPTLSGAGDLHLRDTPIFQFPLFMGLTGFLVKHVPGVDFLLEQDELKAKFELDSDGVKITQLDIFGAIFSASATGRIRYDGTINIRLKGHLLSKKTWLGQTVRFILSPLSSALAFRAEGTINDPKWTPVNLDW
ncbi:MAG: AsmA-like C-terminal region-containing protein [Kiritimatiellaeota bacterium]|nr:AsmA-like C-terminal region-containing protein [Kiritimatiellota bacterium]